MGKPKSLEVTIRSILNVRASVVPEAFWAASETDADAFEHEIGEAAVRSSGDGSACGTADDGFAVGTVGDGFAVGTVGDGSAVYSAV